MCTNNQQRNMYLKSTDLFYIEKHNQIGFVDTMYEQGSSHNYKVHGD
ncbi:hypothetical protein [Pontibacter harenae]